jgi:hypothetical protein
MAGRREGDTKEFRDLTFAEQARSIAAAINTLQSAIEHHVEHAPRRRETIDECIAQVDRLKGRLQAAFPDDAPGEVAEGSAPDDREPNRLRVMSPRLIDRDRVAGFAKEVIESS